MDQTKLFKQLERHEGKKLKPYICPAGYLTIGYGRNLEAKGISNAEADILLKNDVDEVTADLQRRLPVFSKLDGVRQAALINMGYNLGVSGLLKFKKMIRALEAQNWDEAAAQMLDSKWARQVKGRAKELAKQMQTGQWKA